MPAPYDYRLQPIDPAQSILGGVQTGLTLTNLMEQRQAAQAQARQQAEMQTALGTLMQNPTPQAINETMLRYPQLANQLKIPYEGISEREKQARLDVAGNVYSAVRAGKPEFAQQILKQRAEAYRNVGDEQQAKVFDDMAQLVELSPEMAAATAGTILSAVGGPDKFAESFAAIEEEQRKAKQFPTLMKLKQAELRKAESEADIEAVNAKYADRMAQANLAQAKEKIDTQTGEKVQSSEILPDGTVVIVTTGGNTRVVGPDGVELTGQERINAVREAEEFGADIQALRSGSRRAGELSQKVVGNAFESIGKIRQNISNLDSAIAALDAGADTGVIAERFPDWNASTIELRNMQRQLGLDVVGSVTFGALSEGELSLALETALPMNMDEPELKDWMRRKKAAQQKLSDYLTEQVKYLSAPGRTVADWLERAETLRQPEGMGAPGTGWAAAPLVNDRGWRLMRDAQGNRAYVSPDGTQFEEAR